MEYLGRSSVCSGKFPVEPRVPVAFKPVEPEMLYKGRFLASRKSKKGKYTFFYVEGLRVEVMPLPLMRRNLKNELS